MRRIAAIVVLAGCGGAAPSRTQPAIPAPGVAPAPAVAPDAGPPEGYVEMRVFGVFELDGSPTVILAQDGTDTLLPLSIGGTEALAIALRHAGARPPRPLTHDLLDSVLDALGGELVRVQVDALRAKVFHGSVFVRRQGRIVELDSRASDAIALAIGRKRPIYVAQDVLAQAGVRARDLPQPAPDEMPPAPELPTAAP
jgi:hypothetical protein